MLSHALFFKQCNIENDPYSSFYRSLPFVITVDTSATTASNKKTAIPFNLYNSTSRLLVDWGDGSDPVILDPNSYTSTDALSSIYEYDTAGQYTINVYAEDWTDVYLLTCIGAVTSSAHDGVLPLYYFRTTLTAIEETIPNINKTQYYSSASSTTLSWNSASLMYGFRECKKLTYLPYANKNLFSNGSVYTNLNYLFYNCTSLTNLSSNVFTGCTNVSTLNYAFYGCSGLTTLPSDLLTPCTSLTSVSNLFYRTTGLTDFTLHISATGISTVTNFCSLASGSTRTIYVPTGSTTKTKFDSIASSLELTIVEE